MTELTAKGKVHGRVQGVFFRAFTQQQAEQHGVTGYANNESDGSVAFALTGPRDAVESVLQALHDGPRAARVDRVDVTWHAAEPMRGFITG